MVTGLMGKGKHLRIAVGVVCASVVLLATLVMSIPAKAVSITITPSSTSVVQGNSITIDASIAIAANERIPINGVYLRLFSDAGRTIELPGSPYLSPRTMSYVSGTPSSGYGYGYGRGYDPNDGQWYDFFGGYGYGYGFGGGVTLVYRAIVSTSAAWTARTYYVSVDVDADTHTFINTSSFSVTAPPPPPTTTPPTTTPPTTTPPTTTPPTTTPPTTTPPTTTPPTTTPPTTTPPTTTPPTTTPPTTTPPTTTPPTTTTRPPTTTPPTTTATALPITTTPPTTTTGNAIPIPIFGSFSANLSGSTNAAGVTQKPVVVASSKGEVNLTIGTGTSVTNEQGQSVADITVRQEVAPAAPDDSTVVGFSTIIGQEGMKLDKPAPLTLKIDMTKIPAGASASDLTLARFDSKTQKWVAVSSTVDLATGTITGQITDLGEYAIISKNPSAGFNIWIVVGIVAGILVIAGIVFAYTRRKKTATGNLG